MTVRCADDACSPWPLASAVLDAIGWICPQALGLGTGHQAGYVSCVRRIAAQEAVLTELPELAGLDVDFGRLRDSGHVVGIDQTAPERLDMGKWASRR